MPEEDAGEIMPMDFRRNCSIISEINIKRRGYVQNELFKED